MQTSFLEHGNLILALRCTFWERCARLSLLQLGILPAP